MKLRNFAGTRTAFIALMRQRSQTNACAIANHVCGVGRWAWLQADEAGTNGTMKVDTPLGGGVLNIYMQDVDEGVYGLRVLYTDGKRVELGCADRFEDILRRAAGWVLDERGVPVAMDL